MPRVCVWPLAQLQSVCALCGGSQPTAARACALVCGQVECNFLDYVVSPLWERLGEVIPELRPCCAQLAANR